MSNEMEAKDSELLTDLSEEEQESAKGGFLSSGFDGFAFQRSRLFTFANNRLDVSSGTGNISSAQSTGYTTDQTSVFMSTSFLNSLLRGFGGRGRSSRARGMFMNFLFSLFSAD